MKHCDVGPERCWWCANDKDLELAEAKVDMLLSECNRLRDERDALVNGLRELAEDKYNTPPNMRAVALGLLTLARIDAGDKGAK